MVEPQISTPVPVAKTGLAALRQAVPQQTSGDAGSSGFSTMLQAFDIAFADATRPQPAVAAQENERLENDTTLSADAGDDDKQTDAAPNQRRAEKAPPAATEARGTRGGARAPNPAAERSEPTTSTDDQAATEAAPAAESVGVAPDEGSAAATELLVNDAAVANPVTVNLLAGQVMAAPKNAASQKATPISDASATSESVATASPAVVPTAVPDTAATTAPAVAPESVPLSGAAAVPLNAAEKAASVPAALAATKQQDAVLAETALPTGAPGTSATVTLDAVKPMEAPRQVHDASEQGLNNPHPAALPATNATPNPAMIAAATASGGKTAETQAAAAQKAEQLALRGLEAGGRLHGAYGASAASRAADTPQSTSLRAPPVIEQVAVKLNQQAKGGLDQLTIQLRPTDLGRVDIKLSFQDGAVTGTIIADTRTTLDLLVKDQRALERALQDAGLRTESGALSFELRDQSQHSDAQRQEQKHQRGRNGDFTLDVVDAAAADTTTTPSDRIISADRVNLRI